MLLLYFLHPNTGQPFVSFFSAINLCISSMPLVLKLTTSSLSITAVEIKQSCEATLLFFLVVYEKHTNSREIYDTLRLDS